MFNLIRHPRGDYISNAYFATRNGSALCTECVPKAPMMTYEEYLQSYDNGNHSYREDPPIEDTNMNNNTDMETSLEIIPRLVGMSKRLQIPNRQDLFGKGIEDCIFDLVSYCYEVYMSLYHDNTTEESRIVCYGETSLNEVAGVEQQVTSTALRKENNKDGMYRNYESKCLRKKAASKKSEPENLKRCDVGRLRKKKVTRNSLSIRESNTSYGSRIRQETTMGNDDSATGIEPSDVIDVCDPCGLHGTPYGTDCTVSKVALSRTTKGRNLHRSWTNSDEKFVQWVDESDHWNAMVAKDTNLNTMMCKEGCVSKCSNRNSNQSIGMSLRDLVIGPSMDEVILGFLFSVWDLLSPLKQVEDVTSIRSSHDFRVKKEVLDKAARRQPPSMTSEEMGDAPVRRDVTYEDVAVTCMTCLVDASNACTLIREEGPLDLERWLHEEYLSLAQDIQDSQTQPDAFEGPLCTATLKHRQDNLNALESLLETKQELEEDEGEEKRSRIASTYCVQGDLNSVEMSRELHLQPLQPVPVRPFSLPQKSVQPESVDVKYTCKCFEDHIESTTAKPGCNCTKIVPKDRDKPKSILSTGCCKCENSESTENISPKSPVSKTRFKFDISASDEWDKRSNKGKKQENSTRKSRTKILRSIDSGVQSCHDTTNRPRNRPPEPKKATPGGDQRTPKHTEVMVQQSSSAKGRPPCLTGVPKGTVDCSFAFKEAVDLAKEVGRFICGCPIELLKEGMAMINAPDMSNTCACGRTRQPKTQVRRSSSPRVHSQKETNTFTGNEGKVPEEASAGYREREGLREKKSVFADKNTREDISKSTSSVSIPEGRKLRHFKEETVIPGCGWREKKGGCVARNSSSDSEEDSSYSGYATSLNSLWSDSPNQTDGSVDSLHGGYKMHKDSPTGTTPKLSSYREYSTPSSVTSGELPNRRKLSALSVSNENTRNLCSQFAKANDSLIYIRRTSLGISNESSLNSVGDVNLVGQLGPKYQPESHARVNPPSKSDATTETNKLATMIMEVDSKRSLVVDDRGQSVFRDKSTPWLSGSVDKTQGRANASRSNKRESQEVIELKKWDQSQYDAGVNKSTVCFPGYKSASEEAPHGHRDMTRRFDDDDACHCVGGEKRDGGQDKSGSFTKLQLPMILKRELKDIVILDAHGGDLLVDLGKYIDLSESDRRAVHLPEREAEFTVEWDEDAPGADVCGIIFDKPELGEVSLEGEGRKSVHVNKFRDNKSIPVQRVESQRRRTIEASPSIMISPPQLGTIEQEGSDVLQVFYPSDPRFNYNHKYRGRNIDGIKKATNDRPDWVNVRRDDTLKERGKQTNNKAISDEYVIIDTHKGRKVQPDPYALKYKDSEIDYLIIERPMKNNSKTNLGRTAEKVSRIDSVIELSRDDYIKKLSEKNEIGIARNETEVCMALPNVPPKPSNDNFVREKRSNDSSITRKTVQWDATKHLRRDDSQGECIDLVIPESESVSDATRRTRSMSSVTSGSPKVADPARRVISFSLAAQPVDSKILPDRRREMVTYGRNKGGTLASDISPRPIGKSNSMLDLSKLNNMSRQSSGSGVRLEATKRNNIFPSSSIHSKLGAQKRDSGSYIHWRKTVPGVVGRSTSNLLRHKQADARRKHEHEIMSKTKQRDKSRARNLELGKILWRSSSTSSNGSLPRPYQKRKDSLSGSEKENASRLADLDTYKTGQGNTRADFNRRFIEKNPEDSVSKRKQRPTHTVRHGSLGRTKDASMGRGSQKSEDRQSVTSKSFLGNILNRISSRGSVNETPQIIHKDAFKCGQLFKDIKIANTAKKNMILKEMGISRRGGETERNYTRKCVKHDAPVTEVDREDNPFSKRHEMKWSVFNMEHNNRRNSSDERGTSTKNNEQSDLKDAPPEKQPTKVQPEKKSPTGACVCSVVAHVGSVDSSNPPSNRTPSGVFVRRGHCACAGGVTRISTASPEFGINKLAVAEQPGTSRRGASEAGRSERGKSGNECVHGDKGAMAPASDGAHVRGKSKCKRASKVEAEKKEVGFIAFLDNLGKQLLSLNILGGFLTKANQAKPRDSSARSSRSTKARSHVGHDVQQPCMRARDTKTRNQRASKSCRRRCDESSHKARHVSKHRSQSRSKDHDRHVSRPSREKPPVRSKSGERKRRDESQPRAMSLNRQALYCAPNMASINTAFRGHDNSHTADGSIKARGRHTRVDRTPSREIDDKTGVKRRRRTTLVQGDSHHTRPRLPSHTRPRRNQFQRPRRETNPRPRLETNPPELEVANPRERRNSHASNTSRQSDARRPSNPHPGRNDRQASSPRHFVVHRAEIVLAHSAARNKLTAHYLLKEQRRIMREEQLRTRREAGDVTSKCDVVMKMADAVRGKQNKINGGTGLKEEEFKNLAKGKYEAMAVATVTKNSQKKQISKYCVNQQPVLTKNGAQHLAESDLMKPQKRDILLSGVIIDPYSSSPNCQSGPKEYGVREPQSFVPSCHASKPKEDIVGELQLSVISCHSSRANESIVRVPQSPGPSWQASSSKELVLKEVKRNIFPSKDHEPNLLPGKQNIEEVTSSVGLCSDSVDNILQTQVIEVKLTVTKDQYGCKEGMIDWDKVRSEVNTDSSSVFDGKTLTSNLNSTGKKETPLDSKDEDRMSEQTAASSSIVVEGNSVETIWRGTALAWSSTVRSDVKGNDLTLKKASDIKGNDLTLKKASDIRGNDWTPKMASDVRGNDLTHKMASDVRGNGMTHKRASDVRGNDLTHKMASDVRGNGMIPKMASDVRNNGLTHKMASGCSSTGWTSKVAGKVCSNQKWYSQLPVRTVEQFLADQMRGLDITAECHVAKSEESVSVVTEDFWSDMGTIYDNNVVM